MSEKSEKLLNEKKLLISIIGTLEAIKEGAMSITESEKFLFSPHRINQLKRKKYKESLIKILEKGCELEDIDPLLPQNFEKYIEELKVESLEGMKKYESFEQKFWI